jgi:PTH1 family peptidyl-tRNA hydrolase
MKLIVGLGNPGDKYKNNRHNVGFMVVDALASRSPNSRFSKKLQSEVIEIDNLVLAKPQTFMSSSGISVKKLIDHYNSIQEHSDLIGDELNADMSSSFGGIPRSLERGGCHGINTSELWVIHDDLDIRLGDYKTQFGKGPKLHRGISSIEENLATKEFWRVRIGVDNRDPENRISGEEYVLQDFTKEEREVLDGVIRKLVRELKLQL